MAKKSASEIVNFNSQVIPRVAKKALFKETSKTSFKEKNALPSLNQPDFLTKTQLKENLRESLKQVKLIEAGKMEGISIQDLLNEL